MNEPRIFQLKLSASSTGPSTSGHDADVPMTDDETRGRLRERDDEQQDPPRRKRYKQVGKLTVDEDPADYLGDVDEFDCSEERLLETDRVETEKALDQLLEQGVVQDVPADSVAGVKHLTTRWEKCWRMREGKWQYKVRFVGREYKWQEFREDLFAPGASHCTSRIMIIWLSRRVTQRSLLMLLMPTFRLLKRRMSWWIRRWSI